MNMLDLIEKMDKNRILTVLPNVDMCVDIHQSSLLKNLEDLIKDAKNKYYTEIISNKLNELKQFSAELEKAQNQQAQKLKESQSQDDPKILLSKINQLLKQVEDHKVGFITKRKLRKNLIQKCLKYEQQIELINKHELLTKASKSMSSNTINQQEIYMQKYNLKDISYFESTIENCESYSIMPEILNKKYILEGDQYE